MTLRYKTIFTQLAVEVGLMGSSKWKYILLIKTIFYF